MNSFEYVYDKLNSPLEALIGPLVIEGMICIIEHREIMKNHGISILTPQVMMIMLQLKIASML